MSVVAEVAANLFTVSVLISLVSGVFVGVVIGALPGLGATMGVALLLPFTFSLDIISAMVLLIGCYCGAVYGGSVTAILIGSPGTAASAATVADGYSMSKKGLGGQALDISLKASIFGATISGVGLLIGAPIVGRLALEFSSPEFVLLALGGLIVVAGVEASAFLRGLAAAALGVLITTIGVDAISGAQRFTFGNVNMMSGIDFVPVIIGLFAFAEILRQVLNKSTSIAADAVDRGESKVRKGRGFIRRHWVNLLRSSGIGYLLGIIPGIGPTVSSYLAYSRAKRKSDHPEEFGSGSEDGIVAAEAANNGTTGSTLIPLMTLGIPGDSVTAILLGAFLVQGLTPGPGLVTDSPDIVYSIIVGFLLVTLVLLVVGKLFLPLFSKVAFVPKRYLMPTVLLLCVIGTYALNNSMFDVLVMAVFGVLGYLLPRYGFPVTPVLIGVVLGGMIESEFRRSLILSGGSLDIFVTRPISLVLLIAIVAFVAWKVYRGLRFEQSARKVSASRGK